MVDRIHPLKLEDASTGGGTDQFPTETNKNEDYVDCRGVSIQNNTSNDDTVLISRSGNSMTFTDATVSATLSQLHNSGFGGSCQYIESNDQSTTTSSVYQDKLVLNTGILTGSYIIMFECDRTPNSANKRVYVRLYNSTNAIQCCFSDYRPSLANLWCRDVGFTFVVLNNNFMIYRIQFASQDGSTLVRIKEAKIIMWKVG